jgi:DNA-directed RNA polymerase subunit M/transcription elongation factor TFIIS
MVEIYYKNKDKNIFCPRCGNFLMQADKRDINIHKLACKKCGKWIWFKPADDDYHEIKEIPDSRTSGGMTFY